MLSLCRHDGIDSESCVWVDQNALGETRRELNFTLGLNQPFQFASRVGKLWCRWLGGGGDGGGGGRLRARPTRQLLPHLSRPSPPLRRPHHLRSDARLRCQHGPQPQILCRLLHRVWQRGGQWGAAPRGAPPRRQLRNPAAGDAVQRAV